MRATALHKMRNGILLDRLTVLSEETRLAMVGSSISEVEPVE